MFSTIFLQASPLEGMLPLLVMVAAMFLLFLWPQMRKQKKEKQFQEALKPGAKAVSYTHLDVYKRQLVCI